MCNYQICVIKVMYVVTVDIHKCEAPLSQHSSKSALYNVVAIAEYTLGTLKTSTCSQLVN